MGLEIVIIRNGETLLGWHIAADTTRAVIAGACATITSLDAMRLIVERHQTLIVVQIGLAAVPLVADGEHPVGQPREFEQCKCPVALILLRGEVLQLAAKGELLINLVLAISHEDIRVYHTSVTFHDGLVVALIHVHQVQLEVLRDTLVDLDVQVLIVGLVTPFPKTRCIAVGAGTADELVGSNLQIKFTFTPVPYLPPSTVFFLNV